MFKYNYLINSHSHSLKSAKNNTVIFMALVIVNHNNPVKPIQSQCFQQCIFFSSKCILSLFRTWKSSADRCIPIVSAEMQTKELNNSHHKLHPKKRMICCDRLIYKTRPKAELNPDTHDGWRYTGESSVCFFLNSLKPTNKQVQKEYHDANNYLNHWIKGLVLISLYFKTYSELCLDK